MELIPEALDCVGSFLCCKIIVSDKKFNKMADFD